MPTPAMRAVLLTPVKQAYLLYDAFLDTRAAGAVNGTPSTPPANVQVVGALPVRVVTDTALVATVGGGKFTSGNNAAWGDPGLWYPGFSRSAGRILIGEISVAGGSGSMFGWSAIQSGYPYDGEVFFSPALTLCDNGSQEIGNFVNGVAYTIALAQGLIGAYVFVKGGAYSKWVLLHKSDQVDAILYPAVSANHDITTAANIRVPVSLYIPTPLAYSTFGG